MKEAITQAVIIPPYITSELTAVSASDTAIKELKNKYAVLEIKGIDDKVGYKHATEGEKEIKKFINAIEKKRKELNSFYKKTIDDEAGRISGELEPIVKHLQSQTTAIDNEHQRLRDLEIKAKAERIQKRIDAMAAVDYKLDYALAEGLTEEAFASMLFGVKENYEANKAKERQLADLQAELEKQKAEIQAKQIELGIAATPPPLHTEPVEWNHPGPVAHAQPAEEPAQQQATNASQNPDIEHLLKYAKMLETATGPKEIQTPEGKAIINEVRALLYKVSVFINTRVSKL